MRILRIILLFAAATVTIECSHPTLNRSASGIGALRQKTQADLKSKLAAMSPTDRDEYLKNHKQELMGAFGSGMPMREPGPNMAARP